jgi:hypothetical protein
MAFRLKMKVYVENEKTYLVSQAYATISNPDNLKVIIMSDDDSRTILLNTKQYNDLPYRWFEDMGPAPKASAMRPVAW